MKFLKNTLAMVALLAIGSVDARAVRKGATATTRPSGQPVSTQVGKGIQQGQEGQEGQKGQEEAPVKKNIPQKTFKDIALEITKANQKSVWDSKTNLLQDTFVNRVVADCKNSDLIDEELLMLLKLARDKHAQFTGDSKKDTAILTELALQRNDAKLALLEKDEPLEGAL